MKDFKELRKMAGLGNRQDFLHETGYSTRTLTAFDNNDRDPPPYLIKYLRLLASGCQYCPNRKRANFISKTGEKQCRQTN